MADTDKRRFTRVPFETQIRISTGNAVIRSSELKNIGLGGLFVFCDEFLPLKSQCVVDIELRGRASLLEIEVEAEVIRVDMDGMALRFTGIDVDSLIHLRHFIRIRAQDPEKIEREYAKTLLELPWADDYLDSK